MRWYAFLLACLIPLFVAAEHVRSSEIVYRTPAAVLTVQKEWAYVSAAGVKYRACCAVDALHPIRGGVQVRFRREYGMFAYPRGSCRPVKVYLPLLIQACRGEGGSIWALQVWRRLADNYGGDLSEPAPELHLSHISGNEAIPRFVELVWDRKWNGPRLCGKFQYRGEGVFGFKTTSQGNPLDAWGRNMYLDVQLVSGKWVRANSFVSQRPDGRWCYWFKEVPPVPGGLVRLTAIGPGVTPVVRVQSRVPYNS